MRQNAHPLQHILVIPSKQQLYLGRRGLIVPVAKNQFRFESGRTKDRFVLERLRFPEDDLVVDEMRWHFWLPHPFQYDEFLNAHRANLTEGVDYIPYASVGLYCARMSPKGRLFEGAVSTARQRIQAESQSTGSHLVRAPVLRAA